MNWNKELKEEVYVARAFKIEEMKEKYRMTTDKRIEMYGERLLAIQDELAKRDLSEIPTNKLFEMMLKCSKALDAEIPDPNFMTDKEISDAKYHCKAKEQHQNFLKELGY